MLTEQDKVLEGQGKAPSEQGQVQSEQDKAKSKTVEELLAEQKAELEKRYQSEISGLNRKVSEFENTVKGLQKERMTEEERKKAEQDELKAEREALRLERRALMVQNACVSVGLDPNRFAKRLIGETQEELTADAQGLMDFIEAKAHEIAQAEVNKKLTVSTPKTGTPSLKGKLTEEEIEALPTREERQRARKEHGYIV